MTRNFVPASLALGLAAADPEEWSAILDEIRQLPEQDQIRFLHDWRVWARADQLEPEGQWDVWAYIAGRGSGKTRTGAEWTNANADRYPGCRMVLIAPTAADYRDILIEGESGVLATQKPWNPCLFEPSKRRLTWANSSQAVLVSADEPERIRGLQGHFAWLDEAASYLKPDDVWNMLRLALRLPAMPMWPKGYRPRILVTSTPKPTDFVRKLIGWKPYKLPTGTHVTRGSTYLNRANLDPAYFESIVKDLEGTRLGRQELHAEILDDVPGALFKSDMIDPHRIVKERVPALKTIVVAIDPNAGGTDETGIVVGGTGGPPLLTDATDADDSALGSVSRAYKRAMRIHGYVLADVSLQGASPDTWARRAVRAYHDWEADYIVAEKNCGGEMVRMTLQAVDPTVPIKLVSATRNKQTRAEPIVALCEQGRIHMAGHFAKLEEQMLTWDPEFSKSPDRMDAFVWAFSSLMGKAQTRQGSVAQLVPVRVSPFVGGTD